MISSKGETWTRMLVDSRRAWQGSQGSFMLEPRSDVLGE